MYILSESVVHLFAPFGSHGGYVVNAADKESGFDGVMQPDHTPLISLPPGSEDAGWHVGIAFAVGYMKAAATAAGISFDTADEVKARLESEVEGVGNKHQPTAKFAAKL